MSHGMEAGSLLLARPFVALPLLGRFALRIFAPPSLVHVPTLAAGISRSDNEGGEDEETRVLWVEFLLRLYSLVETDNLALAGNILALPRERVAPRKAGRCKVSRVVAIWEKPPHSSAESGMTASTRCNSIINEAGEQCTQFLPRSWAGVVKSRPFVLGECRLFPKERFLRPRPPIFVFLLSMTCITTNQRLIARAFLLSQRRVQE